MAQGQISQAVNISPDGIAAIYRRECKPPNFEPELTAYDDGYGNATIGCGHTGPDVQFGQTITREQADAMFRKDITPCESAVANVEVPLTQNQFDALCSFAFNVGIGAFQTSTLRKVLNAGKYDRVPDEMRKWTKSGGKTSQGLVNRRNSEIGQWTRGAFVSSASVDVDTPPSPVAKVENWLRGLGSAVLGLSVTGDQLKSAGSDLQGLAVHWHWFGTAGVALFAFGVFWSWRRRA